MASKYSPIVDTLISTPLINIANWTAAKKAGQVAPVIVGTDDWEVPYLTQAGALAAVMIGQNISGGGYNVTVFDKRDRVRIKNVIVQCNFADGLLDVSNKILNDIPVVNAPFPVAGISTQAQMSMRLEVLRINSAGEYKACPDRLFFNIPGFGLPLDGDYPEPRSVVTGGIAPTSDMGYIFRASLTAPNTTSPLFSTLSIDPLFQTKRILVWTQIVVEHTFPIMFFPV